MLWDRGWVLVAHTRIDPRGARAHHPAVDFGTLACTIPPGGTMSWWSRLRAWWTGEPPPPDGATAAHSDEAVRAADVMQELREARRRPRARSVRTVLNSPSPTPPRRAGGEIPWYERQRREAALRDDLPEGYDEPPRPRDR